MTDDRRTVTETVLGAYHSADLTCHLDHQCAIDKPMAVGMAAQHGPVGAMLWRMRYQGDTSVRTAVVMALTRIIRRQARRWREWGFLLDPVTAQDFADAIIGYWSGAVCGACHGTRYQLIPGTPTLSDNLCKVCGGEGKVPVDVAFQQNRVAPARWALSILDAEECRQAGRIMAALSNAMEMSKE